MALGWVGGIRSSVQFIYKIVNTLRDLPLHFCEVSFYKSPFQLILHSISQTFQGLVRMPLRPHLKRISLLFEKSILEFFLW